jgi:hypothetical protein
MEFYFYILFSVSKDKFYGSSGSSQKVVDQVKKLWGKENIF